MFIIRTFLNISEIAPIPYKIYQYSAIFTQLLTQMRNCGILDFLYTRIGNDLFFSHECREMKRIKFTYRRELWWDNEITFDLTLSWSDDFLKRNWTEHIP